MTYDEWLEIGLASNFCGPAVCYTHDGLPLSSSEDIDFEENDPCVHILRLYEDEQMKNEVEDNHSPSKWRQ